MLIDPARRPEARRERWPLALALALAATAGTNALAQDPPTEAADPAPAEMPASDPAPTDGPGVEAPADAARPAAPPAPASSPPFWARPKPTQPDCDCDTQAAVPVAEPSRTPTVVPGLLSAGAVVLLFVLWQRLRPRPREDASPRAALAARSGMPLPAESNAGGFDPRARVMPRKAPETGKADLEIADPHATDVEVGEAEPTSQSAGAQAFYHSIAASLTTALDKEPSRQDLRRKLLEIYYSSKQVNEFVNLAHEYLDINHGVRDRFWDEIGAMGAQLAPAHEMFQEWATDGRRPRTTPRRLGQARRFHERSVDQGKMYTAQQALTTDFEHLRADPGFQDALSQLLADAARRPAPLMASPELSYVADGAQIYVKHEDRRRFHDDILVNAMSQLLLAKTRGRTGVVTATRDGVHGHAVASAAARLGMECMIYIGDRDLNRNYARVLSMRRLGAHLRPIPGAPEEADPRRSAMDAWLDDPERTQFVSGLTAGPPPFPDIVREFQAVIGRESWMQMHQLAGGPPTAAVAGIADGHHGIGLLTGLLDKAAVKLYCVEEKPDPAQLAAERAETPELKPGETPTRREHNWLRNTRRVSYVQGDENETLRVVEQFHATGTTLYTQSARVLAYARSLARQAQRREAIVVLLTNQEGADFRGPRNDW